MVNSDGSKSIAKGVLKKPANFKCSVKEEDDPEDGLDEVEIEAEVDLGDPVSAGADEVGGIDLLEERYCAETNIKGDQE